MVTVQPPGGERAVQRCGALGTAPYSDMAGGLYRAFLTPAFHAAQEALAGWMEEAGMEVRRDGAGNLVGRYDATRPDAAALILGSHIDSVRDGGCYDGMLGITLAIECVAWLNSQGRRYPFAIEVYAFGDEEGSRFPAAMLTSRAVAGTLDLADLQIADGDEVTLQEAGADIAAFSGAARTPGSTLAYFEAHIEQGPILQAESLAVGTVVGIAAQLRLEVQVSGVAGHAGTTTMKLRRDALAGAAEMILAVESIAREDNSDIVATVGKIDAAPGAANVIAGSARFTVDVRSLDEQRRDRVAQAIAREVNAIARRRNLDCAIDRIHDLPASPCDPDLVEMVDASLLDAGQPARRMVSGAGHDAMIMAALCPTAMLFVRCRDGISHSPDEHVEASDGAIALKAMLAFIERFADRYAQD